MADQTPPPLTQEEARYVWSHPARVFRHGKDLVAAVPLPEISEPKHVTRARLWQGVVTAFVGTTEEVWDELAIRVQTGELLILERDLTDRFMGVVLS